MRSGRSKEKWDLFFTFVRIGLFTFGGGYAMIPMVENICVEGGIRKKMLLRHPHFFGNENENNPGEELRTR